MLIQVLLGQPNETIKKPHPKKTTRIIKTLLYITKTKVMELPDIPVFPPLCTEKWKFLIRAAQ